MILKKYTGHMYRNSPYETDSDCGNCDGARCETCQLKFYSTITNDTFDTLDEGKEAEEMYFKLLRNHKSTYDLKFIIKDDKLYGIDMDPKFEPILCDEESPLYQEYFEKTLRKFTRYNECKCTNKDDEDDGSCCKYGCDDASCYNDMKNRGRVTKKWYM